MTATIQLGFSWTHALSVDDASTTRPSFITASGSHVSEDVPARGIGREDADPTLASLDAVTLAKGNRHPATDMVTATSEGGYAIEDLTKGETIETSDNGSQPIRCEGGRVRDKAMLKTIRPGAREDFVTIIPGSANRALPPTRRDRSSKTARDRTASRNTHTGSTKSLARRARYRLDKE